MISLYESQYKSGRSKSEHMKKTIYQTIAIGLASFASLPLTAQQVETAAPTVRDPWEGYNRWMYNVNVKIDHATLKPAAKAYKAVTPKPLRDGLSNILHNAEEPWTLINSLLQVRGDPFFETLGRILINSTVGIGGIFDVASKWGVPRSQKELGETLSVWGVPSGPYLMLPFLGPSTPLDAFGSGVKIAFDPVPYGLNKKFGLKASGPYDFMDLLNLRVELLSTADKLIENSEDPYATLRSAYLQNRAYKVSGGKPPEGAKSDDPFENGDTLGETVPPK